MNEKDDEWSEAEELDDEECIWEYKEDMRSGAVFAISRNGLDTVVDIGGDKSVLIKYKKTIFKLLKIPRSVF